MGFRVPYSGINVMQGVPIEAAWVLPRDELVTSIIESGRHIMMSCPPASGKTSLLQLLQKRLVDSGHIVQFFTIGFDFSSPFQFPYNQVSGTFDFKAETVVLIDEAHNAFGNPKFWSELIKANVGKYRVIAAATRKFDDNRDSPAYFQVLNFDQIKLTKTEQVQLYDNITTSADFHSLGLTDDLLKDTVLFQAGGHPATIVTSLVMLKNFCQSRQNPPSLDEIIEYYFSYDTLSLYCRIWVGSTSAHIEDEDRALLQKILLQQSFDFYKAEPVLIKLARQHLIHSPQATAPIRFLFPLARRRFFRDFWPNRARNDQFGNGSNCLTIDDLVLQAIQLFDPTVLTAASKGRKHVQNAGQGSTVPVMMTPKEAVLQHMFFTGLSKSLQLNRSIVPEATMVSDQDSTATGVIDFYVNDELKWGFELLIDGDRIAKHHRRIEGDGAYSNALVRDYRVIDFRMDTKHRIQLNERDIVVSFERPLMFHRAKIEFGALKQKKTVSIGMKQAKQMSVKDQNTSILSKFRQAL
jgi:hypothetical protein